MTRETKIGLLVGLAFIVVFAMLLSHTGTVPPPGDNPQFARNPIASPDTLNPSPSGLASETTMEPLVEPVVSFSPTPPITETPQPSVPTVVQLPVVDMLNPTPADPSASGLASESVPAEETAVVSTDNHALESYRVAPPIPEVPEPTATPRSSVPTVTTLLPDDEEPSGATPSVAVADASSATPPANLPRGATPATAEHVIQKGESLISIAREIYGEAYSSAPTRVLAYLEKSNKDRIKNKHFLIEGQKLATPALPADLFEPVTRLNVGPATDRLVRLDNMVNSVDSAPTRRAPVVAEGDRRPEPEQARGNRTHEIKSGETFSSIARDQLGSESAWREIQRLNKNLDPSKLKPGTKIILPPRKSSSSAGKADSGRSSA